MSWRVELTQLSHTIQRPSSVQFPTRTISFHTLVVYASLSRSFYCLLVHCCRGLLLSSTAAMWVELYYAAGCATRVRKQRGVSKSMYGDRRRAVDGLLHGSAWSGHRRTQVQQLLRPQVVRRRWILSTARIEASNTAARRNCRPSNVRTAWLPFMAVIAVTNWQWRGRRATHWSLAASRVSQ